MTVHLIVQRPGVRAGDWTIKCTVTETAHVNADPADPRTDDISGDVRGAGGAVSADWGLHLIDANIAMGNLVEVVGMQGKAWAARK